MYLNQQQAYCANHPALHLDNRGIIDDAITAAKNALAKVVQAVTAAINAALTDINNAANKVVDSLYVFGNNTVDQVSKITDAALNTIAVTVQAVVELGLDPTGCVGTVVDAINSWKNNYVFAMTKCVNDVIPDIKYYLSKAIDEVKAFSNDLNALAKQLESCGSGLTSLVCIGSFTLNCATLAIQLPAKVVTLAANYVQKFGELSATAVTCLTTNLAELEKLVGSNVQATVKCLSDQIANEIPDGRRF